jgi:hypothetical protein
MTKNPRQPFMGELVSREMAKRLRLELTLRQHDRGKEF